jgi:hypothetical protein
MSGVNSTTVSAIRSETVQSAVMELGGGADGGACWNALVVLFRKPSLTSSSTFGLGAIVIVDHQMH